jgi:predicted DNA-binding transcriptional regulator YafY
MERRATEEIQRVGGVALSLLRSQEHASGKQIAGRAGGSPATVKRALQWLRDKGANIIYEAKHRAWRLRDRAFALPLTEPSLEDLQATLTAAGLHEALGQHAAAARALSLFDELDIRLHEERRGRAIRRDALRVTQSTAVVRDPRWVLVLLGAARRRVVRIRYRSPWKNEVSTHEFEPWQVWLHDGVFYVRGYSRTRQAPRTLSLACIEALSVCDGDKPAVRVPDPTDIWGGRDPRFGIDDDRPGVATITLRGPVARWVAGTLWHPQQKDAWPLADETLVRQLPYRSCRELARRLAGIADGLASVDPSELREEVCRLLTEGVRRLQQAF